MKITVEVADTATNMDVFAAVFLSDEARKHAFRGSETISIAYGNGPDIDYERTELTVNASWLYSPYYPGVEYIHNRIEEQS